MKKLIILLMCTVLVLAFVGCAPQVQTPSETGMDDPVAEIPAATEQVLPSEEPADETSEKPVVEISIADYGVVTVELEPDVAPISVENFLKLTNEGFYNGLTFHRIIDGFMIQGGDPSGDGTGGSADTIKGEFAANGVENSLLHTAGAISMARPGDMDGASSQFFIMDADAPSLDGEYACFGYVTQGLEIINQICDDSLSVVGANGAMPTENQPVIEYIKQIA